MLNPDYAYYNDIRIKNVNPTPRNRLGNTESITLASRLFESGVNTLTFRVNSNAADDIWGVTNLLVRTSNVINLDNPSSLQVDYGYYENIIAQVPNWSRLFSNEEYQTRLHATFVNTGDDKVLTLRGWDIDTADEMAVYLNGTFVQYITAGLASSIYSPTDRLVIPAESMIAGVNTLSFRTTDNFQGFQREKWGLRFDNFRNSTNVDLTAIIMFLLLNQ